MMPNGDMLGDAMLRCNNVFNTIAWNKLPDAAQRTLLRHRIFEPQRWMLICMLLFAFLSVGVLQNCLAEDWPIGRGNLTGTAATDQPLPDEPALLWEYELDGLGFDGGPIIADGKVFAADADGRVVALELNSGKQLWRQEFKDTGFVAPPLFHQDTIYIGDDVGIVRALDAETGKEKWQFETGLTIYASPTPYKGSVLVTSEDGTLYCLQRKDGQLLWKYETGDQLRCGASLAMNKTFLGGCDSRLHIVDVASGNSIGDPLDLEAPTGSTPCVVTLKSNGAGTAVNKRRTQLAIVPTYAGEVFAFDLESGQALWRFTDNDIAQEIQTSATSAKNIVVAASKIKKYVFALDVKTGKLLWKHKLRRRADASPIIAGDRVVVGGSDGQIMLLDLASGEQVWLFEVKRSIKGDPAVADGKLVLTNTRGSIFCFGQSQ